jgi:hypothetical protein
MRGAGAGSPRGAGQRGRLGDRVPRHDHRGAGGRRRRRGHRPYRPLRLQHTDAIVTEDEAAAARFLPRSTAPSCCTTPRPSSPTAASSAWAPRSASPPASCTPAGRWGRAAHQLQVPGAVGEAEEAQPCRGLRDAFGDERKLGSRRIDTPHAQKLDPVRDRAERVRQVMAHPRHDKRDKVLGRLVRRGARAAHGALPAHADARTGGAGCR